MARKQAFFGIFIVGILLLSVAVTAADYPVSSSITAWLKERGNLGGRATAITQFTLAKEQVKCIFDGSATEQKCYSDLGTCVGTYSCTVDVSGNSGSSHLWQSTCGGTAYTILDGNSEYAKFVCGQPTTAVKEQVKCLFPANPSQQKCYASTSYGSTSCVGVGSCVADVAGYAGEKVPPILQEVRQSKINDLDRYSSHRTRRTTRHDTRTSHTPRDTTRACRTR